MRTEEIKNKLQLTVFNQGTDEEIRGYYCGDLLSWVMGRADEGSAWFTIMSNVNVCAVAKLLSFTCVILCEGVTPDDKLLKKAGEEGINLFSCYIIYKRCYNIRLYSRSLMKIFIFY